MSGWFAQHSDWLVVGFTDDPLEGANLDRVEEARRRYTGVAQTIESAVARLEKLTASEDQLRGEYADALREGAEKVHEQLAKAAVRYADVAREVAVYQPELTDARAETNAGLAEGQAAADALRAAQALPDGEPDDEGVLDDAALAADADKANRVGTAEQALAAAKKRVRTAFDGLQVAGRRLGDAVTARNYDDGLTDSGWDKALAVLKRISKALAIIGMVLAVLCFIFPGVAVLVALSVVVAVSALVVGSILYAKGEEGLPDLIFAVLGVALLGVGTIATIVGRNIGNAARAARTGIGDTLGGIAMNSFGPGGRIVPRIGQTAHGWKSQSDWFDPLTKWFFRGGAGKSSPWVPEVGFWRSSWEQMKSAGGMWGNLFKGNFSTFGKDWAGVVGGWSGFRSVAGLQQITGQKTNPLWWVWGVGNSVFTIGTGLIWTGGRTEWRDWRDQWIPDYGALGGDDE